MDVLRLSPSRVNEFRNCPQLYKYRVVDQLPEPPSVDAERGTLIHSILETLFRRPRSERNLEKAIEIAPETWNAQKGAKPELNELIASEKEWFDRVHSLLRNYFELENPQGFDPTHLELHLEKDLSDRIYLHGYVDRIDVAPTGEVRIVDYKTGKAPKPGWERKSLFQLRIYAYLYQTRYGVLPTLLQLLYLGDGKAIKSPVTEREMVETERELYTVAEDIFAATERQRWAPKPSRLCDWCYFKRICPAFN